MTDQVTVILQARTGSSRFPGKVLADLAGRPIWLSLWNAYSDAN